MKPFKTDDINIKLFENARSYEAAVYAVEMVNKVNRLVAEGWKVVDDGVICTPVFDIVNTKTEFGLYIMAGDHCRVWIVGDVTSGEDDLIYCTKKSINNHIGKLRFIRKANIKNLLKA